MRFLICLLLLATPASAQRVLVLAVGGDVDASMSATLARAVETAVRDAVPQAEVITTESLQTSIAVSTVADCTTDEAIGACVSEIADAADAEVVVRPWLGRLGDELLLTMTVTAGSSARLMAQGQRRAPADRPAALLDAIPSLVREVVVQAGLARAPQRTVPAGAIAAVVGGVAGAGVGALILVGRGLASGAYGQGDLNRDDAVTYESLEQPALIVGIGVVVVGGVALLAGSGVAVWSLVGEGT